MLMSNCALVRILMLRLVIPYACTEVNNHVMGIISYLWCIIRCYLCLMLALRNYSFLGCSLLYLFASLHFALSMTLLVHQKSFKPVLPHESTVYTYMRYYFAILSKFVCVISSFQNKLVFCVFVSLAER